MDKDRDKDKDKYKVIIKKNNSRIEKKWLVKIIMWTIVISSSISILSDSLLRKVNLLVAFIILILIILIGIFFDIIGVAVTAADETPFHAMASKKIPSARISIRMIKNADKVSSFCNDVIGDVCGIISGSVGAIILAKVILIFDKFNVTIVSALIGALVAAITVAGKATGKNFAIKNSNKIVYDVSKVVHFFKKD